MLKKERQALILREVNIHNKVILSDLSQKLDVSEDTVRRDIQDLSDAGKVLKVRGGALSKSFHVNTYLGHEIYAYEEKTIIARKAIGLLREGMLVLISGGSTNHELARILPPDLRVTFLTPSISTAVHLMEHPGSETLIIGGQLSKTAHISVGGEVVETLNNYKPDLCLLGVNGIDAKEGITENDWEVAIVKRTMVRVSKKVAVLAISEKLGSVQKIRVCDMAGIDCLITEKDPEHPQIIPYRALGIETL